MNKEWSLEKLYKGYDDPQFKADEQKLDELLKEIAEFTAYLSGNPSVGSEPRSTGLSSSHAEWFDL